MARIVVNVPDEKLAEFTQAMNAMGFRSREEDFVVPEWHKEIVRESIKNTKEEDYIPFEEIKKKYGIK
jgi:hypothetical protein